MKKLLLACMVSLTLTACWEQKVSSSKLNRIPDTPSPLLSLDQTERYLLLMRSKFGSLCDHYYNNPDEPRFQSGIPMCMQQEEQTLKKLEKLGINKLEPEHLREEILWEWWIAYRQRIRDCENNGKTSMERAQCNKDWNEYMKTIPGPERMWL